MNSNQQLLRVLKPVVRDREKAKRLLDRYWQDKFVIVWTGDDVHRAANERGLAVTRKEALTVLHTLDHSYNKQDGVRWSDITDHIHSQVLGRKLTKRELSQFIKQNKITIKK